MVRLHFTHQLTTLSKSTTFEPTTQEQKQWPDQVGRARKGPFIHIKISKSSVHPHGMYLGQLLSSWVSHLRGHCTGLGVHYCLPRMMARTELRKRPPSQASMILARSGIVLRSQMWKTGLHNWKIWPEAEAWFKWSFKAKAKFWDPHAQINWCT